MQIIIIIKSESQPYRLQIIKPFIRIDFSFSYIIIQELFQDII